MRTQTDEDSFEALATSVPCRIDPVSGERTELGPPGLYYGLIDSPDGTHLLVQYLQRPFSFLVPWPWFTRKTEVWSAAGGLRTVLADLPVSDEVPRHGVPTGPRLTGLGGTGGQATLAWAEALDGGDPVAAWPSSAIGSSSSRRPSTARQSASSTCGTAASAGMTWTRRARC